MGVTIQKFKRCTDCGGIKLREQDFHRHRGGFRSVCKVCANERARQYREAHPERIRETYRTYREAHRDEINAYQRVQYRLRKKAANCN